MKQRYNTDFNLVLSIKTSLCEQKNGSKTPMTKNVYLAGKFLNKASTITASPP